MREVLQTEVEGRHPESKDIEAAQGSSEGVQEVIEKMQSGRGKMLVMGTC